MKNGRGNDDGGWTQLSQKYLYESQWYNVRQDRIRLPTDELITYTVVEHSGYVVIVPLMADNRLVMEHVYRYTVQETVLECPSGGIDSDTPEQAARRELREETGYRADTFKSLGSYFGSNGISTEVYHIFLATDAVFDGPPILENTEQIEVQLIDIDNAFTMALSGEIVDGPSSHAIMLAWHHLNH